jgi:ATP-dependent Lon protease
MPSSEKNWKSGPGRPEDDDLDSNEAGPGSGKPKGDLQSDPVTRLVPVFPLPNTVLFPGVSLPLHIFEERYKTMVADVLSQDGALAIALTDEDDPENGFREICAVGIVSDVEDLDEGEKNIVVVGSQRARVVEVVERRPYLVARVNAFPEHPTDDPRLRERADELRRLAMQWVFLQDSEGAQELIQRISLVERPGHLADYLAFHLLGDAALKQEVLETLDLGRRLARVHSLVLNALDQANTGKRR